MSVFRDGNSFSDKVPGSTQVARDVSSVARRQKKNREPLGLAPAPETIPAYRGTGERTAADTDRTGSGLVSPLTEDIDQRTYHPEQTLESADGLFTLVYEPANEVVTFDAVGVEMKLVLGIPV